MSDIFVSSEDSKFVFEYVKCSVCGKTPGNLTYAITVDLPGKDTLCLCVECGYIAMEMLVDVLKKQKAAGNG